MGLLGIFIVAVKGVYVKGMFLVDCGENDLNVERYVSLGRV